jgi:CBS domain-containing protein
MKTTLTARDVMNPVVFTVRDNMTVQELANYLIENSITGAPVTDEMGKLVGMVSLADIAESAGEAGAIVPDRPEPDLHLPGWDHKLSADELRQMHVENANLLVRDIMMPTVYTIPDDTPVPEIAQTMISGRIHRLLVTRENHVVGIVTTLDMLKLLL